MDLNSLLDDSGAGWYLAETRAINNSGEIAGIGTFDPDGAGPLPSRNAGFLLTPVPEPALMAMLPPVMMFIRLRRGRHLRY